MSSSCTAWIIASFIPLPSMFTAFKERPASSSANVEQAYHQHVSLVEDKRHENARWWRNLNRCMSPIGVSVIVIVVSTLVLSPVDTHTNILLTCQLDHPLSSRNSRCTIAVHLVPLSFLFLLRGSWYPEPPYDQHSISITTLQKAGLGPFPFFDLSYIYIHLHTHTRTYVFTT